MTVRVSRVRVSAWVRCRLKPASYLPFTSVLI